MSINLFNKMSVIEIGYKMISDICMSEERHS